MAVHFSNSLTDRFGNPLSGIGVRVVEFPGLTNLALFESDGVTPKANPTQSADQTGEIAFTLADPKDVVLQFPNGERVDFGPFTVGGGGGSIAWTTMRSPGGTTQQVATTSGAEIYTLFLDTDMVVVVDSYVTTSEVEFFDGLEDDHAYSFEAGLILTSGFTGNVHWRLAESGNPDYAGFRHDQIDTGGVVRDETAFVPFTATSTERTIAVVSGVEQFLQVQGVYYAADSGNPPTSHLNFQMRKAVGQPGGGFTLKRGSWFRVMNLGLVA